MIDQRVPITCIIALIVGLIVAGCGTDTSGGADASSGELARISERAGVCLAGIGAKSAQSAADIDFLARDLKTGKSDRAAGAGNGIVEIAEYAPRMVAGADGVAAPLGYLVWVLQKADGVELDPVAAIEEYSDRSDVLVMYVREPDRRQVRGAEKCLNQIGTDLPNGLEIAP